VAGAGQQASPRKIKIGIRSEQMAQVLSGLEPGEQVVVAGAAAVAPAPAPAAKNAAAAAASAPKAR